MISTRNIADDLKDVAKFSCNDDKDLTINADDKINDCYPRKEDYVAVKFLKCSPVAPICAVACERFVFLHSIRFLIVGYYLMVFGHNPPRS